MNFDPESAALVEDEPLDIDGVVARIESESKALKGKLMAQIFKACAKSAQEDQTRLVARLEEKMDAAIDEMKTSIRDEVKRACDELAAKDKGDVVTSKLDSFAEKMGGRHLALIGRVEAVLNGQDRISRRMGEPQPAPDHSELKNQMTAILAKLDAPAPTVVQPPMDTRPRRWTFRISKRDDHLRVKEIEAIAAD